MMRFYIDIFCILIHVWDESIVFHALESSHPIVPIVTLQRCILLWNLAFIGSGKVIASRSVNDTIWKNDTLT